MDNTLKKIIIAVFIGLLAYFSSAFYFNEIQARLIGLIAFLVTLWSNEGLPLGVVSLLPIILFPATDILSTNQTSINYSKSIVFLFLGGFLIAIAVEKIGLHKIIAQRLMSFFPKTILGVIGALAFTSAMLSSLLSNTTTALLLMPIALFLTTNKDLKIRLVLAIAYGASIGGIITPIGTPPNLILLGFLETNHLQNVSFFNWMLKTIPLSLLMLIIVTYVLSRGTKSISLDNFQNEPLKELNSDQKRLKYFLIALIVLLFVNSPFKPYYDGLGLNDAGILLGFGLLMMAPKIGFIQWVDARKIPYEIIFLFGAGFSIAAAFSATNLANDISSLLLGLSDIHPFLLILIIASLVTFTTEVTSNTALISIALPIIYALGTHSNIDTNLILMIATICASYAFMLPIATPPNAIAMSSKVLTVAQMAKYGFLFNIVAILLTSCIGYFFW